MQWIEQDMGIVSTEFHLLINRLVHDPELKNAIASLLERERAGDELDRGEKIPVISDFISSEIERWDQTEIPRITSTSNCNQLDALFRESLREVWGNRTARTNL